MMGGDWGLVEYRTEELYRFPCPVPMPPRPTAYAWGVCSRLQYCRVPAHPKTSAPWLGMVVFCVLSAGACVLEDTMMNMSDWCQRPGTAYACAAQLDAAQVSKPLDPGPS